MGYKTCKTCHICIQCQNINTLRQFDLTNLLAVESRVTQPHKSPFVSSLWGVCFLDYDRLNLMWTYGGRDYPIVAENKTIFFAFRTAQQDWQSHFRHHPSPLHFPPCPTELQNRNMTTCNMAEACKIAGLYLDLYCTCFIRNTCSPYFLFCLGNLTQALLTQNATALYKQWRSQSWRQDKSLKLPPCSLKVG